MVEYQYSDLFLNHETVDILVVDRGATVTKVKDKEPLVSNAEIEIHTEDIIMEAFDLNESLCSANNLQFGCCESSCLRLTIYNQKTIPNTADIEVNVFIYFDGNSETLFQVGAYLVDKDEKSQDRLQRTLTMFDKLHFLRDLDISDWFNDILPDESSVIGIDGFRTKLFEYLAENNYFTDGVVETTLVNDEMLYRRKDFAADSLSCGYILEKLCEINGCFGHINRDGKFNFLVLPRYDDESSSIITDDTKIPPTVYEDYVTKGYRYIYAFDGENTLIKRWGQSDPDKYSTYNIMDNMFLNTAPGNDMLQMLMNVYPNIRYRTFRPHTTTCLGNLTREVGDRITIKGEEVTIKTYILERRCKGLNMFLDTYSAKGEPRVSKFNSSSLSSSINTGTSNTGTSSDSSSGASTNLGFTSDWFINLPEIIRNFGLRLLDEPTNVSAQVENTGVTIKWTDPINIGNNRPCPVTWAGTVIVRRQNRPPRNRWDGTVIVDSKIRDQYSELGFVDEEIEEEKEYFYGIFPYDTEGHYRYTKSIGILTDYKGEYPSINEFEVNDNYEAIFGISLPSGGWSAIKMVYNADHIPNDIDDGDSINLVSGQTEVRVSGLSGQYYFIILMIDSYGRVITSNEMDVTIPERPTNPTVLLDSSKKIALNVVKDFITKNDDGIAYSNFILNANGEIEVTKSSRGSYGFTTNYTSAYPIHRNKATKLYVECSGNEALSVSRFAVCLWKNIKNNLSGSEPWTSNCMAYKWVTVDVPYATFDRQIVTLDISNINEPFYLGFYRADIRPTIYKIWFDDEVDILDDYSVEFKGTAPANSSYVSDKEISLHSKYVFSAMNYSLSTFFNMQTYGDYINYDRERIAQRDSICQPSIRSDGKFVVATNNSWGRGFQLYKFDKYDTETNGRVLINDYNVNGSASVTFAPQKDRLYMLQAFNNGISSIYYFSVNSEYNWSMIYDVVSDSRGITLTRVGENVVIKNNNSQILNAKLYLFV